MSRCTRTRRLEIHHINRNGDNGLSNTIVLCESCHEKTFSYGTPGKSPEPFPEYIKRQAIQNAGHRCECQKLNCH